MSSGCYTVSMELGVCQLRSFSISLLSSVLGRDGAAVRLDKSSSGASVVAIDNKIEQAMDLVKSHLMFAVREEVEVLKDQIKELLERNNQLEQENDLLKNLASPEQMAQFQAQVQGQVLGLGLGQAQFQDQFQGQGQSQIQDQGQIQTSSSSGSPTAAMVTTSASQQLLLPPPNPSGPLA